MIQHAFTYNVVSVRSANLYLYLETRPAIAPAATTCSRDPWSMDEDCIDVFLF